MNGITIGLTGEARTVVDETNTAQAAGSGTLPVFSTPAMLALMEKAAYTAVQDALGEGESTVGTLVNIRHASATPIGGNIRATARVTEVQGRRIVFETQAFDDAGLIGEGVHERFVIQVERFLQKAHHK